MGPRPVSNPPNPWASTEVEYLAEVPQARVQVYEDQSRTIIASNDSPDVGFDYSVNPYRGCQWACAYCVLGSTPILMADGGTRPIAQVREGDEIYGTRVEGAHRRYVRTTVLAHWYSIQEAYRIRTVDGTELVASGEHRFLTNRGWKHVTGSQWSDACRPHLTLQNSLVGTGRFAATRNASLEYQVGYLCGMIRGDGHLGVHSYRDPRRQHQRVHQFRLALADLEALHRARDYLSGFAVDTREFIFQAAAGGRREMQAIRCNSRPTVERIQHIIEWPEEDNEEWQRGFLAGIFDAEGSYSRGILRMFNTDRAIIDRILSALRHFDFAHALETNPGTNKPVLVVRVTGGIREHLRFFHTVDPAITRKRSIEGQMAWCAPGLKIASIEALGLYARMYDLTTGTGDFIANGVVSHNCFARPTHEYLDFGAGTDWETKIVVKPRAPELLREAFEKPKWKGDFLLFSGVTDCFQPLEASYRLTRGCLEVCAEYRNPVGIITKAPLIERDIDVLQELQRVASVSVTVSIPFWDPDVARAVEPWVATPARRLKTIARLAAAGIRVGINIAPVIPALNDGDIPRLLAAAREAGATHAGWVLLRLPGSVKQVFEERLRAALPLRADRVMSRIRETRGGALYDTRWRVRQKGEGEYASFIAQLFATTKARLGYPTDDDDRPSTFRRPERKRDLPGSQLSLFPESDKSNQ